MSEDKNIQFTDTELATLFKMRGNNHKVEVTEATKFANDVITFLDANQTTRSLSPRRISSMTVLTSESMHNHNLTTRSGESIDIPDTLAYLFNFGEDTGYAIISADKRVDAPILGYCDSGALPNEINNPLLAGALADTEDHIVAFISDYENRIDSISSEILSKIVEEKSSTRRAVPDLLQDYRLDIREVDESTLGPRATTTSTTTTNSGWVTTSVVQPLLPVEWYQGFPFNYLVKNKNGSTIAPAGCVAIALAQIMAYWQYPASIDGYTFDWSLLRNWTLRPNVYPNVNNKNMIRNADYRYLSGDEQKFASQVSRLIESIGTHIDMKYTNSGSSADCGVAIGYLYKLGYDADSNLPHEYSYSKVIQSLYNGRPVFAEGYSKKIQHRIKVLGITVGTWSEHGEGHAWVIDGYLNQRKTTTVQINVVRVATGKVISQTTSTTHADACYLHHNWGWGFNGNNFYNGYFIAGSYDAFNNKLESNTRAKVTYDEGNFQFKKNICTGIRVVGTGGGSGFISE